jgi:hypothetical protein
MIREGGRSSNHRFRGVLVDAAFAGYERQEIHFAGPAWADFGAAKNDDGAVARAVAVRLREWRRVFSRGC